MKHANEDLKRWKLEINALTIIGSRIKVTKEGREGRALCPFHQEKTPSFTIYRMDDNTWGYKCHGCGENGNIFQFVQKFDKISFTDAVKRVLDEAGVAGWQDGQELTDDSLPKRVHKENVTFTMEQYASAIVCLEKSEPAQAWLAKRGITMDTARKFCIGFVQSAEKVTSSNAWIHDGWVLFPTLTADRKTITAVKYRSLVAKKKKIEGKENSGILRAPDTSTTMFNLQEVNPARDVWIAEGEPDTLVLAQAGYTAVGYPSGVYKPTDDDCEVLFTAKRRFLAGDNDATGKKAMEDLLKRLRGATYVIQWPNNRKDANDVLTNECGNDTEKFALLVEDLKARAVQTETEPILRSGDEIQPKRIKWLWENKIPLGKITLFAGNPDNGKSLASTSVAAMVSAGRPFPESNALTEPADVLMLLGEDDLEDTAVPRLMAAEANMSRIHFLEGVRPVKLEDREVKLDVDIPAMEKQLEANPDIRLLIIDPISNYLGDVSMVAEQEVRSILIPLKRAAEKFNIAIVIVMHLNKKADLDAISRVGGAMAFIGVARCSWLFVRDLSEDSEEGDEEKPKEKKPDTFSMLRIKNNLVSASRAGLSYSVAVKHIPIPGEQDIITPYIVWGGVIEGNADDALGSRRQQDTPTEKKPIGRPNDKLQKAIKWLEEALQDNIPHSAEELRSDATKGFGISRETLDRAYEALRERGVAKKPFKDGKQYYWKSIPMNATSQTTGDNQADPAQSSLIEVESKR